MIPYYQKEDVGYLRYLVSTKQTDKIKITSSASESSSTPPSLIIRNPITNRWASTRTYSFGQWIQIELLTEKPFYLTAYSYLSHHMSIYYNLNWNFSVSNNGSKWIVVDSHVNDYVLKSFKEEKFTIDKPGYYRFFRLTNTGLNYYNGETTDAQTILYVAQIDLYTNRRFCCSKEINKYQIMIFICVLFMFDSLV